MRAPELRGVDKEGQRTLFVGIVAAFVIYAVGVGVSSFLQGDRALLAGTILIAGSVVFATGWAIAVWRGFRLGETSRAGRRRKDRGKGR